MFIKDPYSLLVEAAENDLSVNTSMALTESQVNSIMESFDEVSEDVVYTAEMVSVIKVGDDYLTEMNALYPYMKSNGITSVAEALNNVAAVNGLQEKAVGLLIESDERTSEMLAEACKKGSKAKEKALDKIKKATKIPAKLKKEGFPVKKKKSAKKEGCAKEGCSKSAVDEFKSDIDAQNKVRDLQDKFSGRHTYSKLYKDNKNATRDSLSGRVPDSAGAHNMKDKKARDKANGKDIKAADHTIKRLDKANQKDAERHAKSINSESATDAGGIFDFDLM